MSPLSAPRPARILIAPDSFKGSATAEAVASNIALGWSSVRGQDHIQLAPMADGGEGTIDALTSVYPSADRRPIRVAGPGGQATEAEWLYLPPAFGARGSTGVVELASTSGITLLDQLSPLDAHSTGFGQAIVAALKAGVSRLILGIGGSASTDGGAGMLQALGYRILDESGRRIRPGNRGLPDAVRVDASAAMQLPESGVVVLSDVTNPLTGPNGSAAVFSPQKGASAEDIPRMDSALEHFAALFNISPQALGAGAAGGTGFGLMVWGADIKSGAEEISSLLNLPSRIEHADLLITGEGRFDQQSDLGKVVGTLRHTADAFDVPVALVAGAIGSEPEGYSSAMSLSDLAGDSRAAMTDPETYLRIAGAKLASNFAARS
ncbi:glycerate kinase [Pseudarthrobacter sp. NamE5]|uniref:glycerate kinase n=1 Tax=Pseudarthrobacter sp. NamE5 TaxID=2576839 RepID=UPI00110A1D16|nr:glycerate kinase [Pseudarthrobacter sp. NamE5]TLM80756.1 glycerate kinase [Pseudarthrobacter sp. NamE5]